VTDLTKGKEESRKMTKTRKVHVRTHRDGADWGLDSGKSYS
jgi:hypothetical protein